MSAFGHTYFVVQPSSLIVMIVNIFSSNKCIADKCKCEDFSNPLVQSALKFYSEDAGFYLKKANQAC